VALDPATQDATPRPPSTTFLFADIAGFTALTEAHGDEEAATLVADFTDAVRAELPAFGAMHVKSIGDALMLRIPEPADAVRLGLRIAGELMRGHAAPAVRVGLHHGPCVERNGDFFGAAVNLAARVSCQAIGGEVLLTAETAALAPDLDGVFYEPRGRRQLRNVSEPVELFAARPADLRGDCLLLLHACVCRSVRSRAGEVRATVTGLRGDPHPATSDAATTRRPSRACEWP
jgi:adenylate cyclase